MAQTSKEIRKAYDRKTYKQFNLRIRRDSDLLRWLEDYKNGGNEVNALMIELLNKHFKHLVKLGVLDSEE